MALHIMSSYSAVDFWVMFWMSTAVMRHTLLDKPSFLHWTLGKLNCMQTQTWALLNTWMLNEIQCFPMSLRGNKGWQYTRWIPHLLYCVHFFSSCIVNCDVLLLTFSPLMTVISLQLSYSLHTQRPTLKEPWRLCCDSFMLLMHIAFMYSRLKSAGIMSQDQ